MCPSGLVANKGCQSSCRLPAALGALSTHLAGSSYRICSSQQAATLMLLITYLLRSVNKRDSTHKVTEHCRSNCSCVINSKGPHCIFIFLLETQWGRPVWCGAKPLEWTCAGLSVPSSNSYAQSRSHLVLLISFESSSNFECFHFIFSNVSLSPMTSHF